MEISILPSLLAADCGALAEACRRVAASGAEALHLDIMDAHFVPNLSFGPDVAVMAHRAVPSLPLNVHLMMTQPDRYAGRFVDAGAATVQLRLRIRSSPSGRSRIAELELAALLADAKS